MEAGVTVRPAGGVRGQVAGSNSRRQPGTGTRQVREGAVIPFTWTWVGHQAMNGLDEGVFHCTVGALGAKG